MPASLPKYFLKAVLWTVIIFALLGCNLFSRISAPPTSSVPGTYSNLDPSTNKYDIAIKSLDLLKKHDFEALESNMNSARQNRERLVGGYWKLDFIYQGLSSPNYRKNSADTEWTAHIADLEAWKQAMPNSISASVALAEAWDAYGIEARGEGLANTVSDENWKLFFERTARAHQELDSSKAMTPKCPEWYVTMLSVAQSESWPRVQYDKVFEEGFRLEPTYYPLQRQKLLYLLPQWFGKEGEISDFIDQNSSRIQGEEGEIMRYLLTTTMQPQFRSDIFQHIKIPWPKLNNWYEILKKHYLVDGYRTNQFGYLAMYGQDVESTCVAFSEIGEFGDPEVWGTQEFYSKIKSPMNEFCRRFAASKLGGPRSN